MEPNTNTNTNTNKTDTNTNVKKEKLWYVYCEQGWMQLGSPHNKREAEYNPDLVKCLGGQRGFRVDFRITDIDGRNFFAYSPDNDTRLSNPADYKRAVEILNDHVEWLKQHGMMTVLKVYEPGKMITIHQDDLEKLLSRTSYEDGLASQLTNKIRANSERQLAGS